MDIANEVVTHCNGYAATRVRHFKRLMKLIEFPPDSVFVDIGCGKGRILVMASEYSFKRVVGVEICKDLCKTARANIRQLEARSGKKLNIQIIESDIQNFQMQDDENVFYLFNPFDSYLRARFLSSVERSIQRVPRQVWLMLNYNRREELTDSPSQFKRIKESIFGGAHLQIFSNVG